MEYLIEKIKNFEQNLKNQMEKHIQKETILFNLIDKIYKKTKEKKKGVINMNPSKKSQK